MLIVGLIKMDRPRVLINPVMCRNDVELYTWLASFFNEENFKLDNPLTQAMVNQTLSEHKTGQILIAGYEVSVLFGEENIMMKNTDRFFYTDSIDFTDFMAQ